MGKTEVEPDSFRVHQTKKNTSPTTKCLSSLCYTPAMKLFIPHSLSQVIYGAKRFPYIVSDLNFDFCAKETFRGKPSLKKRDSMQGSATNRECFETSHNLLFLS